MGAAQSQNKRDKRRINDQYVWEGEIEIERTPHVHKHANKIIEELEGPTWKDCVGSGIPCVIRSSKCNKVALGGRTLKEGRGSGVPQNIE